MFTVHTGDHTAATVTTEEVLTEPSHPRIGFQPLATPELYVVPAWPEAGVTLASTHFIHFENRLAMLGAAILVTGKVRDTAAFTYARARNARDETQADGTDELLEQRS
ncbi:hypothetical protein OPT61_g9187 [Boeremia exigua]|uniref:Uncharacterized protein n=1 Tax=Boeremia exigua TaxID=749465 RepID=A0ACC2HVP1_9PLEO|nr:hypothetical protein OPT61_g9187 [Boeremia exigua]